MFLTSLISCKVYLMIHFLFFCLCRTSTCLNQKESLASFPSRLYVEQPISRKERKRCYRFSIFYASKVSKWLLQYVNPTSNTFYETFNRAAIKTVSVNFIVITRLDLLKALRLYCPWLFCAWTGPESVDLSGHFSGLQVFGVNRDMSFRPLRTHRAFILFFIISCVDRIRVWFSVC